ncbi:histone H4 transcription factor-like [Lytechinus variegatus]|uniref:histone H4 transcription factor-like n=1 Tax=Lytechinus variegatus TaxID=7654 RepID=UPI001BB2460B|nr:histone H4 transcription factor-like [Lytechinus variegatus]
MAPIPRNQRRPLKLQCEWNGCSSVLETTQAFTEHLMGHAEEFIASALSIEKCLADVDIDDTDDYQCQWDDCGYVTNEGSGALLRHLLFHGYHTRIKWAGTVERERCKIETCQLEPHSRNIIPEVPSSFVCSWDDCTFVTNNPDFFYCHVEMHSQMEEPIHGVLGCRWRDCQVKTKDKYKLRDHLRCHSQEKRFGCSQCGGLFSNRTKFFDHIHRQGILDEPNFQCSHCSKVFASERLLRDHMRHHVNHYKCPFCDMTCPAPSVLKKHIQWRHSSDRPFSCELCDHAAKTRTDMRRHMESHNAGDAYSCDIESCAFTAKTLSALRTHFRKCHSDLEEKRYLCHVCQSKFARGHALTNHLKEKHRFKWPSGHVRFRYREHEDGFLRLQTVRYESIELTQQFLQDTSINAPPTAPPSAPPTAPPTATPTATSLKTIPEEVTANPQSSTTQEAKKLKATKKRRSPRKGRTKRRKKGSPEKVNVEASKTTSPEEEILEPSNKRFCDEVNFEPSKVQYVEDSQGSVIIVDYTLDLKNADRSGRRVFDVEDLNSAIGAKERPVQSTETGLYNIMQDQDSAHAIAKNIQDMSSMTRSGSKVTLETGGYPLSQVQYRQDLRTDHQTHVFPIEQLQGVDAEEERSSEERTPKKPGHGDLSPQGIDNVKSLMTSEDEIRSRYPGLEDDRMAMAVEAMTNLSRGFVS